jgi:hypothetical protein
MTVTMLLMRGVFETQQRNETKYHIQTAVMRVRNVRAGRQR